MELKQVIVIRKDLKMRRGKEVAQAAHASNKILIEAFQQKEVLPTVPVKSGANCTENGINITQWMNTDYRKICLQVQTEKEMFDLLQKAQDLGIPNSLVQDNGLTEFGGVKTYTCIAIGPAESDVIDSITGHLKLM